jgi:hypothetical protein
MKKIVLTFGLISGGILVLMMFATIPLMNRGSFGKLEIIGYSTMVASFLMIFFGIRSYRENIGGGVITFGKALKVGLLITLVSCVCYVIAWQIIYFNITPDFFEKYGNYRIEKARAEGATAAELDAQREQMKEFKVMYDKLPFNMAFTLLEPLPVALPVTLISAGILRRKERKTGSSEFQSQASLSQ